MCIWFATLWANSISINRAVYKNTLVTTWCTLLASIVSVVIGKPTMITTYAGDSCRLWKYWPRLHRWLLSLLTCRYRPALEFWIVNGIKKFNITLVLTSTPNNQHHTKKTQLKPLKKRERKLIDYGGRASELVTRSLTFKSCCLFTLAGLGTGRLASCEYPVVRTILSFSFSCFFLYHFIALLHSMYCKAYFCFIWAAIKKTWQGKCYKLLVGLLQCNMNWKVQSTLALWTPHSNVHLNNTDSS